MGFSSLFAKTYFVAQNGVNTNPGTQGKPWGKVQFAIDQMVAGDTVLIREGTYTESLRMMVTSGDSGAPIVVQNYPGERVTIQSQTASGGDPAIKITVNYVEVRGMTLHKLTRSAGPVNVYAGHHVLLDSLEVIGPGAWDDITISNEYGETAYVTVKNCKVHTALHEGIYIKSENANPLHHIFILNNEIYNCPDEAVQVSASPYPDNPPTDVVIKGNNIHDVGAWAIIHLYYAPKNVLIDGNFIHNNSTCWVGVNLDGAEAVLRNNLFTNNSGSQASEDYSDVCVSSEHGNPKYKIINNTFALTTRGNARAAYGVWIGEDACSESDTISNNIFYDIQDGGICYHSSPLNQGSNNIFSQKNNSVPAVVLPNGDTIMMEDIQNWKENNRFVDPLFVDPENQNFQLKPESPAIHKALFLDVKTDFTGYNRMQDEWMDVGAFEFQSDVVLTPPKKVRLINN